MSNVDEKYMTICNLIEALWLRRREEDYWNVDLENLPALTSPQARRIAAFIFDELLPGWSDDLASPTAAEAARF